MSAVTTLLRGALLGAAAMYLLDPDRGRRRRAIARDKARSAATQAAAFVRAARRDARHRMRALTTRATQVARRRDQDAAPDVVLAERVRARLGRVVQHPHAVRVHADGGHVRLSGPILSSEHGMLVAAVSRVRGVRSVDDEALALYHSTEHVSALQGGVPRRRGAPLRWTPAMRLAAVSGGGLLALRGLVGSGLTRPLLSLAGIALLARGATNRPLERLLDVQARGRREPEDTSDDWTATAPLAPPAVQSGL
jgi:osmotically-inducible protein OsmY